MLRVGKRLFLIVFFYAILNYVYLNYDYLFVQSKLTFYVMCHYSVKRVVNICIYIFKYNYMPKELWKNYYFRYTVIVQWKNMCLLTLICGKWLIEKYTACVYFGMFRLKMANFLNSYRYNLFSSYWHYGQILLS